VEKDTDALVFGVERVTSSAFRHCACFLVSGTERVLCSGVRH
jgi:hypothetical protein